MRPIVDIATSNHLRRGADELHARGPDATAEAFAEVARRREIRS